MKPTKAFLFLALVWAFVACKDDAQGAADAMNGADPDVSTFYFIRHSEVDRTDTNDVDPELDQAGLGRAMHWAEILDDVPLDGIYSTDFRATSMTAAPASVKKDINVTYFDPDTWNMEQFLSDNLNKKVLVVGHSDSTPAMINRILGQDTYYKMDDHDYGTLFIVEVVNGRAHASRLSFNCNCPKR